MVGTIVNVSTIIVGSSVGSLLKKGISERYQKNVMSAIGLVAFSLGATWMVKGLSASKFPLLFVFSLIIGSLLGELIDLDSKIKKLNERFSKGDSENNFIEGLVTAVLLFCVGTMSILGPIESALRGNHTLILTNAVLDGFTSMILATNFGIGIIISALVLFVWQGSIYMSAGLIAGFLTPDLLNEISLLGGILILATGMNILNITKIKSLNLLPALLIPAFYFIPVVQNLVAKLFFFL